MGSNLNLKIGAGVIQVNVKTSETKRAKEGIVGRGASMDAGKEGEILGELEH